MSNPARAAGRPSFGKLRPKPQLSCNTCRLRKVKCDRKHPCDTCTNHGYASACEYPPGILAPRQSIHQATTRSGRVNVLSKLNHLESLVHSLVNDQNSNEPPSGPSAIDIGSDTPDVLPSTFGRLALDNKEPNYVGSDHWAAIIDGIAELKNHLQNNYLPPTLTEFSPSICGHDGPEIFHGHIMAAPQEAILASIPPRPVVDRLISMYFEQHEHTPIFLHRPTFLKEYERFWLNPNGTSVMWIGLLFSIMCLAARFQGSYEENWNYGSPEELFASTSVLQVQEYRERTVQCLLAGNYTKPGPYTIETLLLYFMTEHLHHEDAQCGNWILMGQIARIAMRLGLHRDPSHTSQVLPFYGEMRRRQWFAIVQIDLTTSCQMGLPRMIRESDFDTREPLNFLDGDLDEDMLELPEPRPDSLITPILYISCRKKLLSVFSRVSDLATSVKPSSYSEVLKLDEELLEARALIPAGLQLRPPSPSVQDRPDIIMYRIYLDLLFQQARCMLHRKYLIPARQNELYASSRATCIDAALVMLRHQETLHRETKPGGQFQLRRWKLSSQLSHGMLLGVTVLCVDLNQDIEEGAGNETYWREDCRSEIVEALKTAQQILLQSWDVSADARKGATAIGVVLSKAGLDTASTVENSFNGCPAQQFASAQAPSWSLDDYLAGGFSQY